MLCENCHKNQASIHVTEVVQQDEGQGIEERHLCEICAQTVGLPHSPSVKSPADIWKLLQISAQQKRKDGRPGCPGCGLTVEEFRRHGRMGCAKCYETFEQPVRELLERVHGASEHVGRVPGLSDEDLDRLHSLAELRSSLDVAIRAEAYEEAARLRDRITELEATAASTDMGEELT